MKFSYNYVLEKYYKGHHFAIEDRTYDGIIWHGPGPKPAQETLDTLIKEEERYLNIEENNAQKDIELLKELQAAHRQKAIEASRPLIEKIEIQYKAIFAEISELLQEAKETQLAIEAKDRLDEAWYEVSKSQEMINKKARDFLASTDWYVTREQEVGIKIPEEIIRQRAEARDSVCKGDIVYKNWQALREKERPSREEIKQAIRLGGEELKRIKEHCQAVSLKYAKPRS